MSNEYLNQLAEELKKAREKSKLSIDQIFTKTRIDRKYLNAIENGNFSIMPEVYIRAFIREYSKTVGLNPDEIILKYDSAKEGKIYQDNEVEEETATVNEKAESEVKAATVLDSNAEVSESPKIKNRSLYYVIGAISMLLTIFIFYKIFLTDNSNKIVTEKPFEEILEEKNSKDNSIKDNESKTDKTEIKAGDIKVKALTKIESISTNREKESEKSIINQQLKPGELTLTISGLDRSWMRVVSDDDNNVEFIIEPGMTKVFNAKEKFYLHIGNSGGVKLFLNNKDLLFRGNEGRVRKIFISENGIEYLRRTPQLNVNQE